MDAPEKRKGKSGVAFRPPRCQKFGVNRWWPTSFTRDGRFGGRLGGSVWRGGYHLLSFLSMIPIMMNLSRARRDASSPRTLIYWKIIFFSKILLMNVGDPLRWRPTLKNTINTAVQQRTTVGLVGLGIALYSGVELDGQPAGSDSRPVTRDVAGREAAGSGKSGSNICAILSR